MSALSAQLPAIKFLPDDGNDDEDIDTAKTYDKIAELVARHNNAKLKFNQTLFYAYINGFFASYRYVDTDKKYGVYSVPVYEDQEIETSNCPECGAALGNSLEENQNVTDNLNGPGESLAAPEKEENEPVATQLCPQCQQEVVPEIEKKKEPVYVRDEDKPKSRVKHEIYGALFVKVPVYAFNQESCGYLGLYLDKPKDELIAALCYDEKGKLDEELNKKIESEYMINDDRFARSEYMYPTGPEIENREMTTLIQFWLRPSKFNLCKKLDIREKLLKDYPKGCKYVAIGKNKVFISATEEELDKRWTMGR